MLLEAEVERLRTENRLLLDRMLGSAGYAPLTPVEITARTTPKERRPIAPWRLMKKLEADAWDRFNAQFPVEEKREQ